MFNQICITYLQMTLYSYLKLIPIKKIISSNHFTKLKSNYLYYIILLYIDALFVRLLVSHY